MKKLLIGLGLSGIGFICNKVRGNKKERKEEMETLYHVLTMFDIDFERYLNDPTYEIDEELFEKISREYKRCTMGKEIQ
jgi:hypothetical protein